MRALLGGMLLSLALPSWAAEPVQRFALLVGHNQGGGDRVTLRYAHTDAQALQGVLTGLGGVDTGEARLLLDPSADQLQAALADLAERVEAAGTQRTEVVFYYSGHSDEEGLLLGDERFTYPALREHMDAIDAKVRLAILDSCASGALIRSKGGQRVAPFLVDEASDVGGLAYITSSSEDEVSQEADRLGASYFTHYLTTGLRGAADVSGDGRVTLHEAYQFAKDETLQRTERTQLGPQHANYDFQLSGTGDLVLTDLTYTTASLVLDEGLAGRAMVRTPSGALVAELNKPEARSVELGLADGSYAVTLTGDDGRYGTADVELYAGESTVLLPTQLQWFDGEKGVARGATVVPLTEPVERNRFRWEMVPGSPSPSPGGTDALLVGVISSRGEAVEGLAWGTAMTESEGAVTGVQASFGATLAGSLDAGAQLGVAYNDTREGGIGVQLGVGANRAGGPFDGLQFAAGANLLGDGGDAVQFSPGANVAGGELQGLQLASVNVAEGLGGLQLGLVNVGRHVRGAQVGLVNIGTQVDGMQLGVINVADDVRGAPVGLLSFERQGRHDLLLFASDSDWINAEIRLGGDMLYTQIGGGGTPGEQAYVGAGLGVHAPFGERVWLDLDAVYAGYLPIGDRGGFALRPRSVVRGRSTLGVQVFPQLAPFVGASVNVQLPSDHLAAVEVSPAYIDPDTSVSVWPGFFAGVQF